MGRDPGRRRFDRRHLRGICRRQRRRGRLRRDRRPRPHDGSHAGLRCARPGFPPDRRPFGLRVRRGPGCRPRRQRPPGGRRPRRHAGPGRHHPQCRRQPDRRRRLDAPSRHQRAQPLRRRGRGLLGRRPADQHPQQREQQLRDRPDEVRPGDAVPDRRFRAPGQRAGQRRRAFRRRRQRLRAGRQPERGRRCVGHHPAGRDRRAQRPRPGVRQPRRHVRPESRPEFRRHAPHGRRDADRRPPGIQSDLFRPDRRRRGLHAQQGRQRHAHP